MRLLVTGGAGFIGTSFIRHIHSSDPAAELVNLDALTYAGNPANLADLSGDPRYHFIRGDICDPLAVRDAFSRWSPDVVVHFAAESHVDRSIEGGEVFARTNVLGTGVLLEGALCAKVRLFLHVSTDEVYGSITDGSAREDDTLNPSSPYSASKAGSDLLARSYFLTHGLPVIITRCTNNFGPYQYPEKLIPLFVTNLLEGKKVPVYGTGNNVRDWIYVLDHCRALSFLLAHGTPGEIYHIGGGNEFSNLEITREILSILGGDEGMIEYVNDRPGHDLRYSLDCSKVRAMGWSPLFPFREALTETVEWYRSHRDWWEPLKKAGGR